MPGSLRDVVDEQMFVEKISFRLMLRLAQVHATIQMYPNFFHLFFSFPPKSFDANLNSG